MPADCFIPMVIAGLTVCGRISRAAIAGTSTRVISLATNPLDILRLCGETLDQLGVAWRFSRRNAISVARREAVARLDEFVGPKY